MTYLYGLTHSNKDFESGDAFGKNTFTTAFPIALANYLACEKNLPMNYIVADLGEGDAPTTKHKLTPLKDIIGCDPYDAEYHFEDSFEQYSQYAVAYCAVFATPFHAPLLQRSMADCHVAMRVALIARGAQAPLLANTAGYALSRCACALTRRLQYG